MEIQVLNISLLLLQTTNPSNLRNVRVVLLTGQKLNIMCEPNTTGKLVFDVVISHLGLPEHYFFGLTFLQGGCLAEVNLV